MSTDALRAIALPRASFAEVPGEALGIPKQTGIASRFQAPIKVVLYSHDTYGLGHLRRNLAIAERLLAVNGAFDVCLLTGSPLIDQWTLPQGLRVQPLPPVVKTGAECYAPRNSAQSFGMVKGYREALILKTILNENPDFFLVDHSPAGMNGELLSTLALIRREMTHVRTMIGLRDILDSPEIVRETWHEQEIYALLEEAYDDILVYGNQRLFDVAESYGMPAALASRIRYSGHIVASRATRGTSHAHHFQDTVCWDNHDVQGRPVVLVTAGGGGDGYFLMEAYLKALIQCATRDDFYSVMVTGPLMSQKEFQDLQNLASERSNVVIVKYTTNLVPSLRNADLIVAMAGYNTSAEIVAMGKPAILVPRAAPRAEQRIRAALLQRLGAVWSIEPTPKLVRELAKLLPHALRRALERKDTPLTPVLDLRGADRVVEHLKGVAHLHPRRVGCTA